jgi:hypothetical protein
MHGIDVWGCNLSSSQLHGAVAQVSRASIVVVVGAKHCCMSLLSADMVTEKLNILLHRKMQPVRSQ